MVYNDSFRLRDLQLNITIRKDHLELNHLYIFYLCASICSFMHFLALRRNILRRAGAYPSRSGCEWRSIPFIHLDPHLLSLHLLVFLWYMYKIQ